MVIHNSDAFGASGRGLTSERQPSRMLRALTITIPTRRCSDFIKCIKMRKTKRAILKTKVYGFNPWIDQVASINQLMEQNGHKSEAALLRDLIDEALALRRRKQLPAITSLSPVSRDQSGEALQTFETLLLRIIDQGDRSLRAQSINFLLHQESFARMCGQHKLLWLTLVAPDLREQGLTTPEIDARFNEQTEESKEYAYTLVEQLVREQPSSFDPPNDLHSEDSKSL